MLSQYPPKPQFQAFFLYHPFSARVILLRFHITVWIHASSLSLPRWKPKPLWCPDTCFHIHSLTSCSLHCLFLCMVLLTSLPFLGHSSHASEPLHSLSSVPEPLISKMCLSAVFLMSFSLNEGLPWQLLSSPTPLSKAEISKWKMELKGMFIWCKSFTKFMQCFDGAHFP